LAAGHAPAAGIALTLPRFSRFWEAQAHFLCLRLHLRSFTLSPAVRSPIPSAMRRFRLILALIAAFAAAPLAFAASNSADVAHLHVQLTTLTDFLHRPGSNGAGLYFKLEPGWHIYWENPGDSGEPPHIRWTLPDGITAGPLQFPPPSRLPLGPLMDFGYAGEVIFPLELNVAGTAAIGPAILHANVDWLVCREVCIPGRSNSNSTGK